MNVSKYSDTHSLMKMLQTCSGCICSQVIMFVILMRPVQFNNTGPLLLLFCLAAPHLHAQPVSLCFCFPTQRGEASWGNTTASWPRRSWTT